MISVDLSYDEVKLIGDLAKKRSHSLLANLNLHPENAKKIEQLLNLQKRTDEWVNKLINHL